MPSRLSIVLLFLIAWGGQYNWASSSTKAARTPTSLLVESYRLGTELVPSERAILLNYLVRIAGEHRLSYTAPWAEENLRIAHQLALDWNRVAIEKNAIVALSYVRSTRALAQIRTMSLPVSDGVGFPEDVRADGATIVFWNYWRAHRPQGVSEIRATALYLGQTGQYPYVAVGRIVADIATTAGKQSGQLPPSAQTLLSDAYSSYEHGSKFGVENDDFIEFLRAVRGNLSTPLLRQGLELAVDRLLDTDRPADPQTYSVHIETENGSATFHRRQEKLLFELLPLLREVDPEWPVRLIKRDPLLGQAGGHSGKEITAEGVVTPGEVEQSTESVGEPSYGMQEARAQAAGDLAPRSFVGALRLAQSIPDPALRTVALANVAQAVGSSQPEHAKDIEQTIKDTVPTVKESEDRLQAVSALVSATVAAHDAAGFREALDKCFALGDELFEEDMISSPDQPTYQASAYNILDGTIRSAVSLDSRAVISNVEQIQNVPLKAFLLQSLASALFTVPAK